jgi:uncharacterized protein
MKTTRRGFLLMTGLLASAGLGSGAGAEGITFDQATLTLDSRTGRPEFIVDVADNASRAELGLRYRHEIAPDGGLLSLQSRAATGPISISTDGEALPVDLLFIATDGAVTEVHPWISRDSSTPIVAGRPAAALELAGGTIARYGILPGDQVTGGGPGQSSPGPS